MTFPWFGADTQPGTFPTLTADAAEAAIDAYLKLCQDPKNSGLALCYSLSSCMPEIPKRAYDPVHPLHNQSWLLFRIFADRDIPGRQVLEEKFNVQLPRRKSEIDGKADVLQSVAEKFPDNFTRQLFARIALDSIQDMTPEERTTIKGKLDEIIKAAERKHDVITSIVSARPPKAEADTFDPATYNEANYLKEARLKYIGSLPTTSIPPKRAAGQSELIDLLKQVSSDKKGKGNTQEDIYKTNNQKRLESLAKEFVRKLNDNLQDGLARLDFDMGIVDDKGARKDNRGDKSYKQSAEYQKVRAPSRNAQDLGKNSLKFVSEVRKSAFKEDDDRTQQVDGMIVDKKVLLPINEKGNKTTVRSYVNPWSPNFPKRKIENPHDIVMGKVVHDHAVLCELIEFADKHAAMDKTMINKFEEALEQLDYPLVTHPFKQLVHSLPATLARTEDALNDDVGITEKDADLFSDILNRADNVVSARTFDQALIDAYRNILGSRLNTQTLAVIMAADKEACDLTLTSLTPENLGPCAKWFQAVVTGIFSAPEIIAATMSADPKSVCAFFNRDMPIELEEIWEKLRTLVNEQDRPQAIQATGVSTENQEDEILVDMSNETTNAARSNLLISNAVNPSPQSAQTNNDFDSSVLRPSPRPHEEIINNWTSGEQDAILSASFGNGLEAQDVTTVKQLEALHGRKVLEKALLTGECVVQSDKIAQKTKPLKVSVLNRETMESKSIKITDGKLNVGFAQTHSRK